MYKKTDKYTLFEVESNQSIDYLIDLGKSVSQIGSQEPSIIYKQNSTFAFLDNGIYKPIGNVIKDGKLIQTTTSASKWSAFVVPKNGKPYIGQINPSDVSYIKLAFQSTPQIVKNGQVFINSVNEGTPNDVSTTSTRRSAIGIKSDGSVVLVTTLLPYTLKELAQLMISLGCVEALNMDGGGSTTSNYQNEKVTHYERPVSAAIVVKQNEKIGDGKLSTPLLIIDSGHGGSDPGATSNGLKEKELTLQISNYQYARFQQLGIPVALTRSTDVTLEPSLRAKRVKDSGAKYCISNHINAGGGKGVETIHSIYSDGKLAKKFYDAIVSCGQIGRRVFTRTLPDNSKRDYYYMHRDTGAVDTTIIEYGFIDNAEDIARIQSNWKVYAEAVVKAFCEYIGHTYTSPNENAPSTPSPSSPESDILKNALVVIQKNEIIQTPDYWIQNAVLNGIVKGDYAAILIQNTAKKITELNSKINELEIKINNLAQPTEPNTPTNPETPTKPDPTPVPQPKPEEPSNPVAYPPCFLNIPNTPCTRPDGTIDWKGQEPPLNQPDPTTPTNPIPNPPSPTHPETPDPTPPLPEPETPVEMPKDWNQVHKLAEETSVYFQVNAMNGTGVLLKDGYILTAKHVAAIPKMKVQTKAGRWYDVELVSQHPDKNIDIALCKIVATKDTLPYLSLSNKGIKSGQKLLCVGHSNNKKWVKKEGIVVREEVGNQPWEFDCSLPLKQDDSGSGLVNEYGEVVGIAIQSVRGVNVKNGSVWERVDGAEVVNIQYPSVASWLNQYI